MKQKLATLILLLTSVLYFGQPLSAGEYDSGWRLAYDAKNNRLSGYFESYTGWDDVLNGPRFSCVFYMEGVIKGNEFKVNTYHPADKPGESIEGAIELMNDKTFALKLPEEHGGCWNVQRFADEPVMFKLQKPIPWIRISYVTADKTFFHSRSSADKKQKAYLLKNDFVCIEKMENDWAYCTYHGKKTTKGWLRIADLKKD